MTFTDTWAIAKDWFGIGLGGGLIVGWLAGVLMVWKVWSDSDKRREERRRNA